MNIAVVGLGLVGGSMALALDGRHDVRGYDRDGPTRRAAASRGLRVAERVEDLLPADAVIVATPLAQVVATVERLVALAGGAAIVEVGSLKAAVAAYAEGAPAGARIVGLHPMAGSTASGFDAADPAMFQGRPFLVVPTARSDEAAVAVAGQLARELGGTVTVCSAAVHDRAIAAVSALPLATALALARVAREAAPMPIEDIAGPGLRDATRLAATPLELAIPLLRAPGLAAHLASMHEALSEIETAVAQGDDAIRALLGNARSTG